MTILIGIDFSDSSSAVLRHAIHVAESHEIRVVAMHVLDRSKLQYLEASGLKKASFDVLETQAEKRFGELLAGHESGVSIEFVVKQGKATEELNQMAESLGAAFMIISANDLTKKRLGSIAARCVRTAPCDVLVLRDWHGGDFRRIVVCTDFSKSADKAIERAALITKAYGATLEILNVAYPADQDSWGEVLEHRADASKSYEEECKEAVRAELRACVERCSEALDGVSFKSLIIESEMPSVAITEHVKAVGSDLVVMGTRGHSGLASHFIGTNAERLIQDAPVSVFAVR
ncbi:MAG: universal stress protein [Akkermansiaceae bacterium]